ncbi:DUF2167 domain-containing protein [Brevibacillus sp. B_LB10_24]|uniref:DUF2167 domain-containing protein n=1 Tax=Brevibacillus sp. B_LB10_24 TaxID=3380645 RepID=UPI0038B8DC3C
MKHLKLWPYLSLVLAITVWAACIPAVALAEGEGQDDYNWIEGGTTVDMGNQLAELKLDPDHAFLGAEDTKKMMTESNSVISGNEIGSVFPMNPEENWVILFEYENSGYIKDDEKESINADDLLESYKQGTEEHNENLPDSQKLYVDGWDLKPHYDEKTHNLTWSLLGHNGRGEKIINYNVRLLSRKGFVSATLISDPSSLAKDKAIFTEKVLPGFGFKSGEKYEDFDPSTDKIAEYGLTGLILGGAGLAVAKKAGLLALLLVVVKKAWFLIIAIPVAIWNFVRRKIRKQSAQTAPAEATAEADSAQAESNENTNRM